MRRFTILIACLAFLLNVYPQMLPIKVSTNSRFFVQVKDNTEVPLFLMGDTGWKLLKLTKAEVSEYLSTRREQGFNCILGPVMFNFENDVQLANIDRVLPFTDPEQLKTLNEKYLEIFDYIIKEAEANHIYLGLVPMWAQTIDKYEAKDLIPFGEKLGKRFSKYSNVFWVVGGEAAAEAPTDKVEALAMGLENGHLGKQLMTVHPSGNRSSSMGNNWLKSGILTYTYHTAPWLDFNMLQSGHHKNHPNYLLISRDYNLTPVKPVMEAEYFYEDHPQWATRNDKNPYRGTDYDTRKGAYWSVFTGGAGYVYGHHAVWQFYSKSDSTKIAAPTVDWKTALKAPGAQQLRYLASLMKARPYLKRIPDPNIVTLSNPDVPVFALRDGQLYSNNASYIMVYFTDSVSIEINTKILACKWINTSWYNPKTGEGKMYLKEQASKGVFIAIPPSEGDWVLIIDDAEKSYSLMNYISDKWKTSIREDIH